MTSGIRQRDCPRSLVSDLTDERLSDLPFLSLRDYIRFKVPWASKHSVLGSHRVLTRCRARRPPRLSVMTAVTPSTVTHAAP